MYLINNLLTNPYFNIAAEEYLLKESNDDFLMFYVNNSSVIIGKHQNALAETNIRFAVEYNIPIIRRISGGGAVYHDCGNLNFSFIVNGKEGQLVDFRKFTKPVIEVLQKSGVDARFEGKSDIRVNGLKISGNAEHVYKNRILHHGTLLISTDLKKLSAILDIDPNKYKDNAIKSIKSKVINIDNLLQSPNNLKELQNQIFEYFLNIQESHEYSFSEIDIDRTEKLVTEKYNTWEWNFGYSPRYEFRNSAIINKKESKIFLVVEKGIINYAKIDGYSELQETLKGIRHHYQEIHEILKNLFHLNEKELSELAWNFF